MRVPLGGHPRLLRLADLVRILLLLGLLLRRPLVGVEQQLEHMGAEWRQLAQDRTYWKEQEPQFVVGRGVEGVRGIVEEWSTLAFH